MAYGVATMSVLVLVKEHPLPAAVDLARGACVILSLLCRKISSNNRIYMSLLTSCIVYIWSGTMCSSSSRGLSPTLLLMLSLKCCCSPVWTLAVVVLSWLV